MMDKHTLRSVIRTVFYSLLIGALLIWGSHGSRTVSAMVTGILLADYITWLIRTAPTVFINLLHGIWQTAVNVVAGLVVYKVCGITIPHDAEEVALCFLAFLLVVAVKVTYYAITAVEDLDDDDTKDGNEE